MKLKRKYSKHELIFLLKRKDSDAFAYLYKTYYRSLYIVVKDVIGDNDEWAKDILQDGFLRIFNNINQYREERCGIYNWMRIVVKHEALWIKIREHKRCYIEKNCFLYINQSDTSF